MSNEAKKVTQADLLNLVLNTLGQVYKVELPTGEVAVVFCWENARWKVDANLECSSESNATFVSNKASQVMSKWLKFAVRSIA